MTLTLQQCLNSLNTLADEHGARLTTQIMLQPGGGAVVTVFWDGDNLPLEAHLLVGVGTGVAGRDEYVGAFVFDPDKFLWALEEGLSDEEAETYSRRFVTTFEDLAGYLLGRPYAFTQARIQD